MDKRNNGAKEEGDAVEVFAGVNLGKSDDNRLRWTKIGTGRRNKDGTIDLHLSFWPNNAQRIQVRPVSALSGNGLSSGQNDNR